MLPYCSASRPARCAKPTNTMRKLPIAFASCATMRSHRLRCCRHAAYARSGLRYWGTDVRVGVTTDDGALKFVPLSELQPWHWSGSYPASELDHYEDLGLDLKARLTRAVAGCPVRAVAGESAPEPCKRIRAKLQRQSRRAYNHATRAVNALTGHVLPTPNCPPARGRLCAGDIT